MRKDKLQVGLVYLIKYVEHRPLVESLKLLSGYRDDVDWYNYVLAIIYDNTNPLLLIAKLICFIFLVFWTP